MKSMRKLRKLISDMNGLQKTVDSLNTEISEATVNLKELTELSFTCPRCGGGIPTDDDRGKYPGALSRTDNETEICSDCGTKEGLEQFAPRGSGINEDRIMPQEGWWISSQMN